MATIYYDFNATTNGDGTLPTTPKNTWATPSNEDVIRIKRGNVFTRGQLNLTQSSLTFEAWANTDGTDDVTLPKPVITIVQTSGTSGINMTGTGIHVFRNIVFRDFVLTTNIGGTTPNAVTLGSTGSYGVDPGANGEFWYCEFYNIPGNAANFNGNNSESTPELAADRMRVMYCKFDNIGGDCVYGQAKNIEIAYNKMTRMSMRTETGDGVGLLQFNPEVCWIHHNYIDHTDTNFKHCIIVDGVDGSGNCLIEHNTLLGVSTVGINLSESKGIIQKNIIITSGIGVACDVDGSIVRNNYFIVNGYREDNAATVGMLTSNGLVDGNTFLCKVKSTVAALVETGTGRSGNTFRNNLIINAGIGYKRGGGSTETRSNNAFVNTTLPYADSTLVEIALTGSDLINPTITADGRPAKESSLIGAGVFINYNEDMQGSLRKNPPTIGAYEYITERATAPTRGVR